MDSLNEKYIRAGSPSTPLSVLMQLANDEIDNVRRRVGENLNTPIEILNTLARDESYEVRIAVGENPNTPLSTLKLLVNDQHVDVRYAMAENPSLPPAILQLLADDENPYVNHRANRTLRLLNPTEVSKLEPEPGISEHPYQKRRYKLL